MPEGNPPEEMARRLKAPLDRVRKVVRDPYKGAERGWVQRLNPLASELSFLVITGTAVLAPFLYLTNIRGGTTLPARGLIQLSAFLLILLGLGKVILSGRIKWAPSPLHFPLFCLLGWASLSLLWAISRYEGRFVLLHWAACGIFYLFAASFGNHLKHLRRLVRGLFFAGVCVSLLGILQYLFQITTKAHNDFLQVLSELGLVGLLLVLWVLATAVAVFCRVMRKEPDAERRSLAAGVALGMTGLVVDACFSFPFLRSVPILIFMIYLGILAGAGGRIPRPEGKAAPDRGEWDWPLPRGVSIPAMILLGFLFISAEKGCLNDLKAGFNVKKMVSEKNIGNWQQVLHFGERALYYDPGNRLALFMMAEAYEHAGEPEAGIGILKNYGKRFPWRADANFRLGNLLKAVGRYDAALEAYRKVIAVVPDFSRVYDEAGLTLMLRNSPLPAIASFKKGLKLEPNFSSYRSHLAGAALEAEDFALAESSLLKALELNPRSRELLLRLAEVYKRENRPEKAASVLREAEESTREPTALLEIGKSAMNLECYEEAIRAFEKIVRVSPETVEAYRELAAMHSIRNEPEEAKEWGKRAKKQELANERASAVLYEEGEKAFKAKNYPEAEKAFVQLLKVSPDKSEAYLKLVAINFFQRRFQKALGYVDKAIALEPENGRHYFNRGAIFMEMKEFPKAEIALRKSLQLNPLYVEALIGLGNLLYYHRVDGKEEAIALYRKALHLNPNHPEGGEIRKILRD